MSTETEQCPRCEAQQPHLHPALAHEGEVHVCTDPWHASTEQGRTALRLSKLQPSWHPPLPYDVHPTERAQSGR